MNFVGINWAGLSEDFVQTIEARDLSVRGVAKEIGCSFSTVQRVIQGSSVTADTVAAICTWMEKSMDDYRITGGPEHFYTISDVFDELGANGWKVEHDGSIGSITWPNGERFRVVVSRLRSEEHYPVMKEESAPEDARKTDDLITLLHRVDGHLGLAVYRGEGCDDRWKKEAEQYIGQLRRAIKELEA